MNDLDLMELCKEVYKRTGWKYTERRFVRHLRSNRKGDVAAINVDLSKHEELCPLYTSDYLLEKLPRSIKHTYDSERRAYIELGVSDDKEEWCAQYGTLDEPHNDYFHFVSSDTPLKALLKLTIALDDAKELSK